MRATRGQAVYNRQPLEEIPLCLDTERHKYSPDCYLRPESRIQIWRGVQERVAQVAPFLVLDKVPYAVLSEGKQYWIQDAYTVSDRYPYSNVQTSGSAQGMNYIRNSVKVVVDMYNARCRFTSWTQGSAAGDVQPRISRCFKDLSELSAD